MNEEELRELEKLEGPCLALTPKPIIDMTDEELTAFVQKVRDCTTQHPTFTAHQRVKKEDLENEEEREMFE